MKIETANFGNGLKNIYLVGSKPIQDWQRIFLFLVSIIIGVGIWSYYFNFTIKSELALGISNVSQSTPTKDKEAEIKDVVDKYKAREASFAGIQVKP
ncbi:MAG: hypothetical protein WCQ00_01165 [bacterium]